VRTPACGKTRVMLRLARQPLFPVLPAVESHPLPALAPAGLDSSGCVYVNRMRSSCLYAVSADGRRE